MRVNIKFEKKLNLTNNTDVVLVNEKENKTLLTKYLYESENGYVFDVKEKTGLYLNSFTYNGNKISWIDITNEQTI